MADVLIGVAVSTAVQFITQRLLGPDTDPTEPPDIAGNELSGASEGDPVNVLFGRNVRVPGTVIWAAPKIVRATSVGVKGGPGANRSTMHEVYQDFSVKFAKGTKIDNLLRVWANNEVLFDHDPVVSITDNRYELKRQEFTHDTAFGGPTTQYWMEIIRISDFVPTLHDKFPSGTSFSLSDTTGTANDGSFVVMSQYFKFIPGIQTRAPVTSITGSAAADEVTVTMTNPHGRTVDTEHKIKVEKATGTPDITGWHDARFTGSTTFTFPFLNPASTYTGDLQIASANVKQELLRFNNASGSDGYLGTTGTPGTILRVAKKLRSDIVGTLVWHDGDETVDETVDEVEDQRSPQTADPHIAAIEGESAYPMLGHAYVTFQGMLLADFGNTTPNIQIECEADADETTATAIEKILTKAGLSSAQYDTKHATAEPLHHYVWRGVQKPAAMLRPLLSMADNVDQQDGEVLRIMDRDPVYRKTEGRKFERGYSPAISYTATTLTDTRQLWETDEWVGARVREPVGGKDIEVASNTSTVLTGVSSWGVLPAAETPYTIHALWAISSGPNLGPASLTDLDAAWATDRWVGATVTVQSGLTTRTGIATSNTATKIFIGEGWSSTVNMLQPTYTIDPMTDFAIDSEDLAAHEAGAEIPKRLTVRQREREVPSEVHLSYVNVESNHDRGVVVERDETTSRQSVLKVDSQVGMTENQASLVAARHLWREISEREEASFSLPPSYAYLAENDRVKITLDGQARTIRVTKIDRGENGVMECSGVVQVEVDMRRSSTINVAEPV